MPEIGLNFCQFNDYPAENSAGVVSFLRRAVAMTENSELDFNVSRLEGLWKAAAVAFPVAATLAHWMCDPSTYDGNFLLGITRTFLGASVPAVIVHGAYHLTHIVRTEHSENYEGRYKTHAVWAQLMLPAGLLAGVYAFLGPFMGHALQMSPVVAATAITALWALSAQCIQHARTRLEEWYVSRGGFAGLTALALGLGAAVRDLIADGNNPLAYSQHRAMDVIGWLNDFVIPAIPGSEAWFNPAALTHFLTHDWLGMPAMLSLAGFALFGKLLLQAALRAHHAHCFIVVGDPLATTRPDLFLVHLFGNAFRIFNHGMIGYRLWTVLAFMGAALDNFSQMQAWAIVPYGLSLLMVPLLLVRDGWMLNHARRIQLQQGALAEAERAIDATNWREQVRMGDPACEDKVKAVLIKPFVEENIDMCNILNKLSTSNPNEFAFWLLGDRNPNDNEARMLLQRSNFEAFSDLMRFSADVLEDIRWLRDEIDHACNKASACAAYRRFCAYMAALHFEAYEQWEQRAHELDAKDWDAEVKAAQAAGRPIPKERVLQKSGFVYKSAMSRTDHDTEYPGLEASQIQHVRLAGMRYLLALQTIDDPYVSLAEMQKQVERDWQRFDQEILDQYRKAFQTDDGENQKSPNTTAAISRTGDTVAEFLMCRPARKATVILPQKPALEALAKKHGISYRSVNGSAADRRLTLRWTILSAEAFKELCELYAGDQDSLTKLHEFYVKSREKACEEQVPCENKRVRNPDAGKPIYVDGKLVDYEPKFGHVHWSEWQEETKFSTSGDPVVERIRNSIPADAVEGYRPEGNYFVTKIINGRARRMYVNTRDRAYSITRVANIPAHIRDRMQTFVGEYEAHGRRFNMQPKFSFNAAGELQVIGHVSQGQFAELCALLTADDYETLKALTTALRPERPNIPSMTDFIPVNRNHPDGPVQGRHGLTAEEKMILKGTQYWFPGEAQPTGWRHYHENPTNPHGRHWFKDPRFVSFDLWDIRHLLDSDHFGFGLVRHGARLINDTEPNIHITTLKDRVFTLKDPAPDRPTREIEAIEYLNYTALIRYTTEDGTLVEIPWTLSLSNIPGAKEGTKIDKEEGLAYAVPTAVGEQQILSKDALRGAELQLDSHTGKAFLQLKSEGTESTTQVRIEVAYPRLMHPPHMVRNLVCEVIPKASIKGTDSAIIYDYGKKYGPDWNRYRAVIVNQDRPRDFKHITRVERVAGGKIKISAKCPRNETFLQNGHYPLPGARDRKNLEAREVIEVTENRQPYFINMPDGRVEEAYSLKAAQEVAARADGAYVDPASPAWRMTDKTEINKKISKQRIDGTGTAHLLRVNFINGLGTTLNLTTTLLGRLRGKTPHIVAKTIMHTDIEVPKDSSLPVTAVMHEHTGTLAFTVRPGLEPTAYMIRSVMDAEGVLVSPPDTLRRLPWWERDQMAKWVKDIRVMEDNEGLHVMAFCQNIHDANIANAIGWVELPREVFVDNAGQILPNFSRGFFTADDLLFSHPDITAANADIPSHHKVFHPKLRVHRDGIAGLQLSCTRRHRVALDQAQSAHIRAQLESNGGAIRSVAYTEPKGAFLMEDKKTGARQWVPQNDPVHACFARKPFSAFALAMTRSARYRYNPRDLVLRIREEFQERGDTLLKGDLRQLFGAGDHREKTEALWQDLIAHGYITAAGFPNIGGVARWQDMELSSKYKNLRKDIYRMLRKTRAFKRNMSTMWFELQKLRQFGALVPKAPSGEPDLTIDNMAQLLNELADQKGLLTQNEKLFEQLLQDIRNNLDIPEDEKQPVLKDLEQVMRRLRALSAQDHLTDEQKDETRKLNMELLDVLHPAFAARQQGVQRISLQQAAWKIDITERVDEDTVKVRIYTNIHQPEYFEEQLVRPGFDHSFEVELGTCYTDEGKRMEIEKVYQQPAVTRFLDCLAQGVRKGGNGRGIFERIDQNLADDARLTGDQRELLQFAAIEAKRQVASLIAAGADPGAKDQLALMLAAIESERLRQHRKIEHAHRIASRTAGFAERGRLGMVTGPQITPYGSKEANAMEAPWYANVPDSGVSDPSVQPSNIMQMLGGWGGAIQQLKWMARTCVNNGTPNTKLHRVECLNELENVTFEFKYKQKITVIGKARAPISKIEDSQEEIQMQMEDGYSNAWEAVAVSISINQGGVGVFNPTGGQRIRWFSPLGIVAAMPDVYEAFIMGKLLEIYPPNEMSWAAMHERVLFTTWPATGVMARILFLAPIVFILGNNTMLTYIADHKIFPLLLTWSLLSSTIPWGYVLMKQGWNFLFTQIDLAAVRYNYDAYYKDMPILFQRGHAFAPFEVTYNMSKATPHNVLRHIKQNYLLVQISLAMSALYQIAAGLAFTTDLYFSLNGIHKAFSAGVFHMGLALYINAAFQAFMLVLLRLGLKWVYMQQTPFTQLSNLPSLQFYEEAKNKDGDKCVDILADPVGFITGVAQRQGTWEEASVDQAAKLLELRDLLLADLNRRQYSRMNLQQQYQGTDFAYQELEMRVREIDGVLHQLSTVLLRNYLHDEHGAHVMRIEPSLGCLTGYALQWLLRSTTPDRHIMEITRQQPPMINLFTQWQANGMAWRRVYEDAILRLWGADSDQPLTRGSSERSAHYRRNLFVLIFGNPKSRRQSFVYGEYMHYQQRVKPVLRQRRSLNRQIRRLPEAQP